MGERAFDRGPALAGPGARASFSPPLPRPPQPPPDPLRRTHPRPPCRAGQGRRRARV